jgi:Zn-dependent membrane protease YugP
LIAQPELRGISGVHDAAALTCVAAAAQAVSTLLYYGFLLLGQRQEET